MLDRDRVVESMIYRPKLMDCRCVVIDCGEMFRMDAAGDGVSTESKSPLTLTVYIFSFECSISCLPLHPSTDVSPIWNLGT